MGDSAGSSRDFLKEKTKSKYHSVFTTNVNSSGFNIRSFYKVYMKQKVPKKLSAFHHAKYHSVTSTGAENKVSADILTPVDEAKTGEDRHDGKDSVAAEIMDAAGETKPDEVVPMVFPEEIADLIKTFL